MVALEQESMQRNGFVLIMFGTPNSSIMRWDGKNSIVDGIPARLSACHFVLLRQTLHPVAQFVLAKLGREFRLRTRIHTEGKL